MGWWGKILGGTFGMMFGGPLGAMLGVALGHNFDKGVSYTNGQSTVNPALADRNAHKQYFIPLLFQLWAMSVKQTVR